MNQPEETTAENTTAPCRRRSFRWRGADYRLDSSTWQFWGGARLMLLPGEPPTFRMTPDDALFRKFTVDAGYVADEEETLSIAACQAFLEQAGHQVWTVQQALEIVRDDTDTTLAEQLMDRLLYFFFVIEY